MALSIEVYMLYVNVNSLLFSKFSERLAKSRLKIVTTRLLTLSLFVFYPEVDTRR